MSNGNGAQSGTDGFGDVKNGPTLRNRPAVEFLGLAHPRAGGKGTRHSLGLDLFDKANKSASFAHGRMARLPYFGAARVTRLIFAAALAAMHSER